MKIIKGKIHNHFNRDIYWSKIDIFSDDNTQETTVFFCVSDEYLRGIFGNQLSTEQVNKWFEDIFIEYENMGADIFKKKINYKIYATTIEGKQNGLDFLINEITPK